jgi:EAL domain-containing protein (putative c-di-GMP-specific phosphodiesterase class I)
VVDLVDLTDLAVITEDVNVCVIGCEGCTGASIDFDLRMALQPIVNTTTRTLFAQEALVRGPNQEPAGDILAKVNDSNRYSFDQVCHRLDRDRARRTIVRGIVQVCRELEIQAIAEGIETRDEVRCLQDLGLELFQGYYFARPAFEAQAAFALDA